MSAERVRIVIKNDRLFQIALSFFIDFFPVGFNDFLIADNFIRREPGNILPIIVGQIADRRMEAILLVRLFNINLNPPIRKHFRMNDFSMIIQRQKWIHHCDTTSLHLHYSAEDAELSRSFCDVGTERSPSAFCAEGLRNVDKQCNVSIL